MTDHIIVDSHCHLDFPDFEGEIPDLVARANDAGVKRMVTICTKLKNEPSVRKIAEEHEAVYYAAGTHPMSAASEPLASVDQLIEISQQFTLAIMTVESWIDLKFHNKLIICNFKTRVAFLKNSS